MAHPVAEWRVETGNTPYRGVFPLFPVSRWKHKETVSLCFHCFHSLINNLLERLEMFPPYRCCAAHTETRRNESN